MKPFKSKKHKKKINYMIIFTSDATDSKMKQLRLSPWVLNTGLVLLCVLIGTIVGYIVYGGGTYQEYLSKQEEQEAQITKLQEENLSITEENNKLIEKVTILSETVNQKVQVEQELAAKSEEMSIPKEFPLTGSAKVEETTTQAALQSQEEVTQEDGAVAVDAQAVDASAEDQPICIFTAVEGTTAVVSGNGTVVAVEEDLNYGYKVVIEHGNGYQSTYLNKGDPKVKQGDEVAKGVTLFVIGEDNTTLGYQIQKDGVYINPMEIISISG